MNHQRSRPSLSPHFLLAALLACGGCTSAKPSRPTAVAPKKPDAPPTHTVTRGTLKRTAQLDAVFEAVEMQPVKIEPKTWMDLTVIEAVPHGSRVKRGDPLVKLDTEKIRDQIDDLEQDRPGAATALEIALAELENLTQTTPQRLEAAKRSRRVADEDYTYFEATGRDQREKSSRFNLKGAEQRLENEMEELKQLEKMYKADDLTEETEEIILKRQRFAVESAQFWLESSKLSTERELKVFIPRDEENLKAQRRDTALALGLAEETLPKALAKKRLDVEKTKRDQRKSEKRLADLKRDLEGMNVRAPLDGLVYYGAWENAKWTTGAPVMKKLVPGAKLTPFEVFMTVVNPDRLQLKAVVPEGELAKLKPGMSGEAAPTSTPDKKLPVKLEDLGRVPMVTGGFEARLSVPADATADLMPGMAAKLTLSEGPKANILVAPKETVFSEGDQRHVFVLKSDGQHEKRSVKTGTSDDKQIEILEGLSEGDKILLKKPE